MSFGISLRCTAHCICAISLSGFSGSTGFEVDQLLWTSDLSVSWLLFIPHSVHVQCYSVNCSILGLKVISYEHMCTWTVRLGGLDAA